MLIQTIKYNTTMGPTKKGEEWFLNPFAQKEKKSHTNYQPRLFYNQLHSSMFCNPSSYLLQSGDMFKNVENMQ